MNVTLLMLVVLSILEAARGAIHFFATRYAVEDLAVLEYRRETAYFVGLIGAENISTAVRTLAMASYASVKERPAAIFASMSCGIAAAFIGGNTVRGDIGGWHVLVAVYTFFAFFAFRAVFIVVS